MVLIVEISETPVALLAYERHLAFEFSRGGKYVNIVLHKRGMALMGMMTG